MKRNLLIGAGAVAVLLIVYFFLGGKSSGATADIITEVVRGPFKIEIETTGELEAKNSVKILGPTRLRDFQIWQLSIESIIDEGTVVKKGDWVATLDPSEFQNKFSAKQIELEKENAEFVQTQLDTTLLLREARDQVINLRYAVDEKRIILEQSKFEPPATIKQAEINYERAAREYEQARENYKIKKRQNAEKMKAQSAEFRKVQNEFNAMSQLLQSFTILAPEPGMVIYTKGNDGKPIKGGSQIRVWDPTVATLPDLTKMMSKTYVNEVDVRRVIAGQKVEIGLDAYPDKKLSGVVTRVANVGEQRPNSDAKVFEVAVEIDGTDPTLRPSMTTSNKIIAKVIDDALFIPLECLHNQADTVTYVYKKEGMTTVKQEVMIGDTNANDVVILSGLTESDRVHLSIPSGLEGDNINLLKEMDGKRKKAEPEKDNLKKDGAPVVVVPTAVSSN
ncbi:MAG: HlyD family efflux transporter periplasmic adaptor subunit [Cyclobacteriaceae bacterium]|nr:HlyD family efflux transporter periplasmic adaptor subunit [Cyclobacteriaceae bacterium]MDH4295960.1 HlyD family efflux transporter periplasmic adaptor subunit [Cyclobacteriaceae bacterium]MDH5251121.1 HlyD family efflux transporter periplasmic adaptor subunit [Cyclobacteriaceae bacterium]